MTDLPSAAELRALAATLTDYAQGHEDHLDEAVAAHAAQALGALATTCELPAYEKCEDCDGSGLTLNMAGEPDTCRTCKGDTVTPVREPPAVEGVTPMPGEEKVYPTPYAALNTARSYVQQAADDGHPWAPSAVQLIDDALEGIAADHARLSAAGRGAQESAAWRWVPIEPTREMLDAMSDPRGDGVEATYRRVLRAAPPPPQDHSGAPQDEGLRERIVGYANIYRWDSPPTPDDGGVSGFDVGDGNLCATPEEAAQTAYAADLEPDLYMGVAEVRLLSSAPRDGGACDE
jgi:hypothetical protein